MSNQIEGIFLAFEGDESERIFDSIAIRGYSPDVDGLKKYIIDHLTGKKKTEERNSDDRLNNVIALGIDFIQKNPHLVKTAQDAGTAIIGNMLKRRF